MVCKMMDSFPKNVSCPGVTIIVPPQYKIPRVTPVKISLETITPFFALTLKK